MTPGVPSCIPLLVEEVKSQMFPVQTDKSPSGSSPRWCDREKLKHPRERTQKGTGKGSGATGLLPTAFEVFSAPESRPETQPWCLQLKAAIPAVTA